MSTHFSKPEAAIFASAVRPVRSTVAVRDLRLEGTALPVGQEVHVPDCFRVIDNEEGLLMFLLCDTNVTRST
jgi:hypothetical protein